MTITEAKAILSHKSPIDVKIYRFIFRAFCWHGYSEHLAESSAVLGPILVRECSKCGHRKYKSMDGT